MTPLLLAGLMQCALTAAPSSPPPPPPSASECFPTCRDGYLCHAGQCVSACNPACEHGEVCSNGQCVSPNRAADAPLASFPVVSDDGERAPRGYHFEERRTKAMLVSGSILLGAGYLLSVLSAIFGYDNQVFAGTQRQEGAYLLYAVPLVGPILGRAALTSRYGSQLSGAVDWFFAVITSASQMTGLTLLVLGSRKTQQLVSDQEYARSSWQLPVRWSLAPSTSGNGAGLTLTLHN